MRNAAVIVLVLSTQVAMADPSWTDVPALLDSALATHGDALRACVTKLPRDVGFVVQRDRAGATRATFPLLGVGVRGPTPEETCLVAAVGAMALPPLPAEIERIALRATVVAARDPLAKHEKRFDDWRDPAAVFATVLDAKARAALGACARAPRTVRLVFDRVRDRTRIWLPAWQFHAANGDGTTPPAEARVKACASRVLRGWSAPVLPMEMGELQVAIPVSPRAATAP